MERIENIVLNRFRNNEHFQYMTDVNGMVIKATPTALNVDGVFTKYSTAYINLDEVLRIDQGSIKTEQLTEFDSLRDKTWSALYARTKATLQSPIAEEAESAKIIKRVFDLYGNVRRLAWYSHPRGPEVY